MGYMESAQFNASKMVAAPAYINSDVVGPFQKPHHLGSLT